jgi:hypothetical protein
MVVSSLATLIGGVAVLKSRSVSLVQLGVGVSRTALAGLAAVVPILLLSGAGVPVRAAVMSLVFTLGLVLFGVFDRFEFQVLADLLPWARKGRSA